MVETDETDGNTKLGFDPNGNTGEKRGLIRILKKRQNGEAENINPWIRL